MKQWLLSVKSNKVKYILVFCVVMQLLCTGLCLVNYALVRKAGDRELSDYSDQLVEAISSDFQRNNTYLQTIMLTSSYRKMFLYSNMDWVNTVARLQETSALCNRQAYTEYYFFALDVSRDSFLEAVAVQIPFSQYRQIRPALLEACRGEVRNGVYRLLTLEDGSRILYTLWKYDDYVCGCWITEETFLKTAYLLDSGTPYRMSLVSGSAGLTIPMVEADFSLSVHSLDRTRQLRSTVLALFQAILSLAVTVALADITNTVNRKLLMPARTLSNILEKYSAAPQRTGIAEGARRLLRHLQFILCRVCINRRKNCFFPQQSASQFQGKFSRSSARQAVRIGLRMQCRPQQVKPDVRNTFFPGAVRLQHLADRKLIPHRLPNAILLGLVFQQDLQFPFYNDFSPCDFPIGGPHFFAVPDDIIHRWLFLPQFQILPDCKSFRRASNQLARLCWPTAQLQARPFCRTDHFFFRTGQNFHHNGKRPSHVNTALVHRFTV